MYCLGKRARPDLLTDRSTMALFFSASPGVTYCFDGFLVSRVLCLWNGVKTLSAAEQRQSFPQIHHTVVFLVTCEQTQLPFRGQLWHIRVTKQERNLWAKWCVYVFHYVTHSDWPSPYNRFLSWFGCSSLIYLFRMLGVTRYFATTTIEMDEIESPYYLPSSFLVWVMFFQQNKMLVVHTKMAVKIQNICRSLLHTWRWSIDGWLLIRTLAFQVKTWEIQKVFISP